MGSNARMDPKLPSNFGTCPGLPLQPLARNPFLHVILNTKNDSYQTVYCCFILKFKLTFFEQG